MRHPAGKRLTHRALASLRRLQLAELVRHYNPTVVLAVFNLVNGGLSIGLLAAVAHTTGSTFIFPSLGPTAFLLFYTPTAAAASPRNTLLGHLIGAIVGWISLAAFGLLNAPPALSSGVPWTRVGAAALSLGGTSGLMVLLRAAHPPAGATTLIVSLGLMPHPWQIPILMAAVLLLTAQAFVINRLAGVRYPLWTSPEAPTGPSAS
jgi:CBS domain-containing membrane protein